MAIKKAEKSAETCLKVRLAYLLDRREFSSLTGLTTASIHYYEHGLRTPRMSAIRKYIEVASKKKIKLGVEDFRD